MAKNETILRFDNVSFDFAGKRKILEGVNFSMRAHSRITLMGQNGAGKSTIFRLITGELRPKHGETHVSHGFTLRPGSHFSSSAHVRLRKTLHPAFALHSLNFF